MNTDTDDDADNLVSSIILLSPYQASSNDVYLPIKLVRGGLIHEKPTAVTLIDAVDDEYHCKIRWKYRKNDRVEAFLTGGWKEFCMDNRFTTGVRVRLSVNPRNPKVIYAREAFLGEEED